MPFNAISRHCERAFSYPDVGTRRTRFDHVSASPRLTGITVVFDEDFGLRTRNKTDNVAVAPPPVITNSKIKFVSAMLR